MLIGAPKTLAKGTPMKLRSIAIVLTVALASAAAYAQSGVYVTADAQQFTQEGIYLNPGTHSNIDQPWLYGAGYGVYFDVSHVPYVGVLPLLDKVHGTGPVVIGIDARGDTLRVSEYGSQLDRQDGLFSLRVAPKKSIFKSTPYLVGGFGVGHTRIPFAAHYTNNFIYEFGIGADRKITKNLDWRMFEATAGFLGNYEVNNLNLPNQTNYLVTLKTGIVFRLR
jgi:hypothetical protein